MRRLAWLGFAALTLCALVAAAVGLTWCTAVPAGTQVAGRALGVVSRALVGRAFAGETMEFHTVSPESARVLDLGHRRIHKSFTIDNGTSAEVVKRVPSATPTPPVPPAPDAAEAPEAPETPDVVVHGSGRSGDMMRIGQDIHIESGQTVTGDVVAMGGDIVVDGHVEGDVQAMGGDVYLNSGARVDGDVFCMGGALHEQPGSQVGGQRVTALGPKSKHWDRRMVRVNGGRGEDAAGERPFRHLFGVVVWALLATLLAWGFFMLGPGRSGAALARFRGEAGHSFMVGLLAALVFVPGFIAVALLAAILCITLIGIPVAVVLLLAYPAVVALLWVWGFAIGAAAIGQRISMARTAAAATAPGGAAPAPAALPSVSAQASWAALGSLVIWGAVFVGTLMRNITGFGPLDALGVLLLVLAWVTLGVVSTIGAGALVRHEFAHGPLRRWWSGRQNGAADTPHAYGTPPIAPPVAPATVVAPSAVAPPPVAPTPVAPPPAPAPPTAYMPPSDPPPPAGYMPPPDPPPPAS